MGVNARNFFGHLGPTGPDQRASVQSVVDVVVVSFSVPSLVSWLIMHPSHPQNSFMSLSALLSGRKQQIYCKDKVQANQVILERV
jgi:hypothetical protein